MKRASRCYSRDGKRLGEADGRRGLTLQSRLRSIRFGAERRERGLAALDASQLERRDDWEDHHRDDDAEVADGGLWHELSLANRQQ